ncbi:MAG: sialidase family protein, partial [Armatimonadota bacterium]
LEVTLMITYLLVSSLASAACQAEAEFAPIPVPLESPQALTQWHVAGGDWRIEEGVLRQDSLWASEVTWEATGHIFLKQPALSDFIAHFEFQVDEAQYGVGAPELLFRSTDSRSYYLVQFTTKAGGVYLVRESHDEHWIDVQRAREVPLERGRWHSVQVAALGDTILVFVDGGKVIEAQDGELSAGLVGFGSSQGLVSFRNIGLWGRPAELAQPWQAVEGKVVPPEFRVICEDAGAGGYEAFPDICRCANGDLLCVFYAGYAHVSFPNDDLPQGARVCAVRSSDEGRTWSEPFIVADTDWDDRDPSVMCLSDGTLLCNWFTYYGNFREPEGDTTYRYKELWLSRSTDDGHTWSEPELIPHMAGAYWACSSPIIELSNGELLWPVYREYRDPLRNWSAVIRSADGGRTWGEPEWVDEGNDDNDEPCLWQMPDGRILCVMRTNAGDSMWYSWSEDLGHTWTTSREIGFRGNCPYLLRTDEGVLLLGHRHPQTSLHYSLDDGQTWSENVQLDVTGGAYPSMVQLRDGSVLVVYYEEGPGSSIRAQRIRASQDGIKRLDWETGD